MKKQKKIFKGVSLIEVLVAIAIISILTSIGVGGYYAFKKGTEIDLNSQQITNLIRQTQNHAKAMKFDSAWGIKVTSSQATIFQGTTFASRTQSRDEVTSLKGLASVSGITEIVFDKLTGLPTPSSIGNLTLGNGTTNKIIQINAEGLISY